MAGYRSVVGVASIGFDLATFVIGHILVIARRKFQPTKVNSPFLMLAMLYHKVISIVRNIASLRRSVCRSVCLRHGSLGG